MHWLTFFLQCFLKFAFFLAKQKSIIFDSIISIKIRCCVNKLYALANELAWEIVLSWNFTKGNILYSHCNQVTSAFATEFLMKQTAHRHTTTQKSQVLNLSVTTHSKPAGTDLLARRVIECQTTVFPHSTAVPMRQVGFEEDIRPCVMEWCREQPVITGSTTAAGGVITSKWETVVVSSCTDYKGLRDAIIDTVVLDIQVRIAFLNKRNTRVNKGITRLFVRCYICLF